MDANDPPASFPVKIEAPVDNTPVRHQRAILLRLTEDKLYFPDTLRLPNIIGLGRLGAVTTLSVGRKSTEDVYLDSPYVPQLMSRYHGILKADINGNHHVVDLDSLNGTYVNGNLITPNKEFKLMTGDIVSYGGPAWVIIPAGQGGDSTRNPFRFVYTNHWFPETRQEELNQHVEPLEMKELGGQHGWKIARTTTEIVPCFMCAKRVPAGLVRFIRFPLASSKAQPFHVHARVDCIQKCHRQVSALVAPGDLVVGDEVTMQEQRVCNALLKVAMK